MPKKDDAPTLTVCDGCGMERDDIKADDETMGYHLCDACADRRKDDPAITIMGRTMPLSEFLMQVETDEHLGRLLESDTVREQVRRLEAGSKHLKALDARLKELEGKR